MVKSGMKWDRKNLLSMRSVVSLQFDHIISVSAICVESFFFRFRG